MNQAAERITLTDPVEDAPSDIRDAVYETRQLNAQGICGVMHCGRALSCCIGCAEHDPHSTPTERLEARMRRLVPPRVKRYY